jgi:transcription elongation factor Elf1
MPETIELSDFEINFTFNCPKCDYRNESISASDMANGNAECGMCETLFKVEGIDGIKIIAILD